MGCALILAFLGFKSSAAISSLDLPRHPGHSSGPKLLDCNSFCSCSSQRRHPLGKVLFEQRKAWSCTCCPGPFLSFSCLPLPCLLSYLTMLTWRELGFELVLIFSSALLITWLVMTCKPHVRACWTSMTSKAQQAEQQLRINFLSASSMWARRRITGPADADMEMALPCH